MQSIGIFGGTFDPVHDGHLALARLVRDRFALDGVLIVPAPNPPHKRQPLASYGHRVAMLELALQDCSDCGQIACSRIEETLPTPSYSINTVESVMQHLGAQCFFLVIGMDSLADLPNWYQAERLLTLIDLVVVNRKQANPSAIHGCVLRLRPSYRSVAGKENVWVNQAGKSLHFVQDFHMPFSSTAIRGALCRGEKPAGLPDVVYAYIRDLELYKHSPS
ncbi:MAG: nicotinate (nicotinamide) nucleotide adenylyltransferase [Desulfobulbaceae bacterium]|nr:nicotinate (nicotinamide) nucleotide adenylyltransferase [Desulfobulbaceae bacterium]